MQIRMDEYVRPENAAAVFYAVVDSKCDTRSKIAEKTNMSVVTVGKACEVFLNKGIFILKRSQSKAIGRHANRMVLNTEKQLIIIDMSTSFWRAHFYDLNFVLVHRIWHEIVGDLTYKDNMRMFLNKVKTYLSKEDNKRFLATCLIVPGIYDNNSDTVSCVGNGEIERIQFHKYIKDSLRMTFNMTIGGITAAIKYCQNNCNSNENVLFLKLDKRCTRLQMRLVSGGRLLKNSGRGYMAVDPERLTEEISSIISSVSVVSGVSKVYVENDLRWYDKPIEGVKELLDDGRILATPIPDIILCNAPSITEMGGVQTLRKNWLDNFVCKF